MLESMKMHLTDSFSYEVIYVYGAPRQQLLVNESI